MDEVHAALLDVVMPKKNGREVHDFIRAHRPSLPIVFASGYSFDILKADLLPKDDYVMVNKPFVRSELLQAIHHVFTRENEA